MDSFEKLLKRTQERATYKDVTVANLVERTKNVAAADLIKQNTKYNEGCYANFANTAKLQRAKKRYYESIDAGKSSVIKRKSGRFVS